AEDGIRDFHVTGVQTCALPISLTAPENPLDAKVEASVDVTSIDTNDENRDAHLRSADFFDVENHPTIEFVSTGARVEDGDFFVEIGRATCRERVYSHVVRAAIK